MPTLGSYLGTYPTYISGGITYVGVNYTLLIMLVLVL